MTERSLWTAYIGPPTTYTEGGPVTMGVSFVPSVDGLVTALKWYRGSAGAGIIPQRLSLWNRSSGNKIAEVVSPTDNNVVGWKQFPLVSPAALAQGVTYTIAFDVAGSVTAYRHVNGTPPLPDTNLAWSGNMRAYRASLQNAFPVTVDNFGGNLVDIVFDDAGTGPPPDDPATAADVNALLGSWLILGAGNDHVGQLPNQTYEEITDTSTGLPAILTAVGNAGAQVIATEAALAEDIEGVLTAIGTPLAAALGPLGNLATGALKLRLDDIEALNEQIKALQAQATGGPQGMVLSTDEGWTLVSTGEFTGPFEVTDRCDRVYVSVDNGASGNVIDTVLGHDYMVRYYWWQPVFASFAGRYSTVRGSNAVLYEPGMRMDGVRVFPGLNVTGTWEAWRFDG